MSESRLEPIGSRAGRCRRCGVWMNSKRIVNGHCGECTVRNVEDAMGRAKLMTRKENVKPVLLRELSDKELTGCWVNAERPDSCIVGSLSHIRRFAKNVIEAATELPETWWSDYARIHRDQLDLTPLNLSANGHRDCSGDVYVIFVPDSAPTVSLAGDYTADELREKLRELESR